jgi:uncharacterized repeat protein (TIGR03803 family)
MRLKSKFAISLARQGAFLLLLLSASVAAHATTATESGLAVVSGTPSQLIQAHDGNFYGTASTGGASGKGFVFQATPGGALALIYSFTNGADGGAPQASLIEGNDGNLYGTTTTGAAGSGALFRLTLGGTITPLHSFAAATDGSNAGALIQNNAGDLFGAANNGGASGLGTVFEYDHGGNFLLVHTFTGTAGDGARPNTQLLQASDDLIYGSTVRGGALSNSGSLFRFDPASFASFATYGSFPPTNQSDPNYNPSYGLTEGADGSLYGLTAEGGTGYGTIYRVVPGATPVVTLDLYDLVSFPDGGLPESGLFLGGDGNFYGTTSSYGMGGPPAGTFFQYIPAGAGTFTALYAFNSPLGNTQGTPLEGADGNFYGPFNNTLYKIAVTPPIPAPVTVTASAAAITLGQSVTIGWQVTNAFSQTAENCYAHGGWSGSQALSGSVVLTPAAPGTYIYALTCGGVESSLTTVVVNGVPVTPTPVITPSGGTYYGPKSYTITDAAAGATIYYTTDGTTPTPSSTVWNGFPKVIVQTTTIKAIAIASPLAVSAEAAATLTINNVYRTCKISYVEGFHPNPNLVLNHGASIAGTTLELSHDLVGENTSVFALPRIPVKTFVTAFRFRFFQADATSADGLTFTVQADAATAVGQAGGGLGYDGIIHSVALKFDLHNNAGEGNNSVGVYFDGAFPGIPAVDLTPSGINLHSGHTMLADVTWDSKYLTLQLKDSVTGKTFSHVFALPADTRPTRRSSTGCWRARGRAGRIDR